MRKTGFTTATMTIAFLVVSVITAWAYTPPAPREPQPGQEKAASQASSQPPSSYDVQEGPLSRPGNTKEVPVPVSASESKVMPGTSSKLSNEIEAARTSAPEGNSSVSVDVSQGMNAVQKALDQLPKNGTLEITGQGVLNSDSLRIPAGATINLSQDVSLVLGDLTAGDIPAIVNTGSVGAGTSMTASSSALEITGSGTMPLTVDALKADIQQLQKNLKAATTAEARVGIQKSIQRDRELIREMRQSNMKSIHKKNLPVIHQHTKKK